MRMVINSKFGQLSNRIILIAHGMATAIDKGNDVLLTEFDDLQDNYTCEVTWGGGVKICASRLWSAERFAERFLHKFLRFRWHFPNIISDWTYRDYVGVEKYHDEITRFFSPRSENVKDAMKFKCRNLENAGTIVGVHIRRGDYKDWCGGRFYYGDDVYVKNMQGVAKELGGRVVFVIFSNECLSLETFGTVDAKVVMSQGSAVEDHWLMSNCDYLLGPPSTFSRWGAYMGRKPIAFIEDPKKILHLSDFKYISI